MRSERRYRDIGGGRVKCDRTGTIKQLVDLRPGTSARVIELSDQQWAKLILLARHRKMTPSECVARFIETSQPGGSGFIVPGSDK